MYCGQNVGKVAFKCLISLRQSVIFTYRFYEQPNCRSRFQSRTRKWIVSIMWGFLCHDLWKELNTNGTMLTKPKNILSLFILTFGKTECKACAAAAWRRSVKPRSLFPASRPPHTNPSHHHALSRLVHVSEATWRRRGRWFGRFTMEGLGVRPQRGCWRGLDTRAAFCWETVTLCREPCVCVWGELCVSHPCVCLDHLHWSHHVFYEDVLQTSHKNKGLEESIH